MASGPCSPDFDPHGMTTMSSLSSGVPSSSAAFVMAIRSDSPSTSTTTEAKNPSLMRGVRTRSKSCSSLSGSACARAPPAAKCSWILAMSVLCTVVVLGRPLAPPALRSMRICSIRSAPTKYGEWVE